MFHSLCDKNPPPSHFQGGYPRNINYRLHFRFFIKAFNSLSSIDAHLQSPCHTGQIESNQHIGSRHLDYQIHNGTYSDIKNVQFWRNMVYTCISNTNKFHDLQDTFRFRSYIHQQLKQYGSVRHNSNDMELCTVCLENLISVWKQ